MGLESSQIFVQELHQVMVKDRKFITTIMAITLQFSTLITLTTRVNISKNLQKKTNRLKFKEIHQTLKITTVIHIQVSIEKRFKNRMKHHNRSIF